jgi:hypothetical protein
VTFLVDGSADVVPGQLSLAIVPYMTHDAPGGVGTELPVDSTAPFSVDIAKPDVSSLTVTGGTPTSDLGGSSDLQQPATNPATSGGGSTTGGGSSTQVPNLTAAPPPATSTAPVDNAAPQVATPAGTQNNGAIAPAGFGMPKPDNTAHNAALAMLVLVAMAVIASSSTPVQRAPRLLGGAGRHTAGAATGGAAPAAVVVAAPAGVRGLGRFARERVGAPRPLV